MPDSGGCPRGGDVGWFGAVEAPWGPAQGTQPSGMCCIPLLRHSPASLGLWFVFFTFFSFHSLCTFFLLLNLTCILSFCGVVYLVVYFLCNLVIFCIICHNNSVP